MHTLISITRFPYAASTIHFGNLVASAFGSNITLMTVRPKKSEMDAGNATLAKARDSLPEPPPNHFCNQTQLLDPDAGAFPIDLTVL